MKNTGLTDELGYAAASLADAARNLFSPSLRLGITGLSRSGKTVCITAMVHNLVNRAPMPLFDAARTGRLRRAWLEPQPDAQVPRFAFEEHLAALTAGDERHWPESTRQMAQLRLMLEYEPQALLARGLKRNRLALDMVDYPGEWLLDLPLLDMDFAAFSDLALGTARQPQRRALAAQWLSLLEGIDADAPYEEETAQKLASAYRAYLSRCKREEGHFAALLPGRFLMPGDMEGSPALTFCPLPDSQGAHPPAGSLRAEMQRRYRAYVQHVVRPFFYGHFARLDAQLVLVDVIGALNAGEHALNDLRDTLRLVLSSFRVGSSHVFARRIRRILFAATQADLIPSAQHERLQRILALLVEEAAKRAEYAGASFRTMALAAVRATREGMVRHEGEELPVIIGVPEAGQRLGDEEFDGRRETAVFPGDLPEDPRAVLREDFTGRLRFVRFRPPDVAAPLPLEPAQPFPHIRMDAMLDFLLGEALA